MCEGTNTQQQVPEGMDTKSWTSWWKEKHLTSLWGGVTVSKYRSWWLMTGFSDDQKCSGPNWMKFLYQVFSSHFFWEESWLTEVNHYTLIYCWCQMSLHEKMNSHGLMKLLMLLHYKALKSRNTGLTESHNKLSAEGLQASQQQTGRDVTRGENIL